MQTPGEHGMDEAQVCDVLAAQIEAAGILGIALDGIDPLLLSQAWEAVPLQDLFSVGCTLHRLSQTCVPARQVSKGLVVVLATLTYHMQHTWSEATHTQIAMLVIAYPLGCHPCSSPA